MNFIFRIFESIIRLVNTLLVRVLEWIRRFSGGGGVIPDDKCCSLARKDKECNWVGSKSNFTCGHPYHRQWWYCCEGTQQLACGECTTNTSSCWSGTFDCSIWWYTGQTC